MLRRLRVAMQMKRVRRYASNIVLQAAETVALSEVADLVPAVSEHVGKPVKLEATAMDNEGMVVEDTRQFTIYLAQGANREVTLAHELGHIVLGHKCCTISDTLHESGSLAEWSLAVEEMLQAQAEVAEREADAFADQILFLLEVARAGGTLLTLRWAAGNSS